MTLWIPCPECGGAGVIERELLGRWDAIMSECERCGGSGEIFEDEDGEDTRDQA